MKNFRAIRVALAVLTVLFFAQLSLAEPATTRPAGKSAPATPPVKSAKELKADEQKIIKSTTPGAPTPELLLKKASDAWFRRDSKRFMACLDQSDSDLRVMAKGWGLVLETFAAREDLSRAMSEHYGKDAPEPEEIFGSHPIKHGFDLMDDILDHVDDLKIEVKDDRAIARFAEGKGRVEMLKQKDVWVLDDTRYTMAAKANEDAVTNMLILARGLLDTYRAGRPLVDQCKTLDQFKPRFRSAAVKTMAPTLEQLKQRREAENRK